MDFNKAIYLSIENKARSISVGISKGQAGVRGGKTEIGGIDSWELTFTCERSGKQGGREDEG